MARTLEELRLNEVKDFKRARLSAVKYLNDDIDAIDAMAGFIGQKIQEERSEIAEKIKGLKHETEISEHEREDLLDFLHEDEAHFLDEVENLRFDLAILALHKKIEISTRRALKFFDENVSTQTLHYHGQFLKHVKDVIGIDIERIDGYVAANEVRLIGNAIKHSGDVSPEMIALGWPAGKLGNLEQHYGRLREPASRFIGRFIDQLIARL